MFPAVKWQSNNDEWYGGHHIIHSVHSSSQRSKDLFARRKQACLKTCTPAKLQKIKFLITKIGLCCESCSLIFTKKDRGLPLGLLWPHTICYPFWYSHCALLTTFKQGNFGASENGTFSDVVLSGRWTLQRCFKSCFVKNSVVNDTFSVVHWNFPHGRTKFTFNESRSIKYVILKGMPPLCIVADSSQRVNRISKHIIAIANIEVRDLSRRRAMGDNVLDFKCWLFKEFSWKNVFIIQTPFSRFWFKKHARVGAFGVKDPDYVHSCTEQSDTHSCLQKHPPGTFTSGLVYLTIKCCL